MKKSLALLIGVMLVLILTFAACSQPTPTAKYVRFNESETHTFKITLSDFANNSNNLFNVYTKKFSQKGEDGKTTETTVTCYKDDIIMSTEATLMNGYDQLRPVDASGTYTMNIQYGSTTTKYATTQILYSQYNTEDLQALNCLETLKDYNVTNKEENPFSNNEGRTTLRSETKTEVVFTTDADQTPVSSLTENKGFYIGKIAQAVSNYKYVTTYDFDNKKVTVTKNDGEAEERELKVNCIDANQLLMYMRSLDKSSEAFQDSPSVTVYDATTGNTSTVTFALNRQFYLIFDNNGTQSVISVNALLSSIGGMPFMAQYNLPDMTKVGDGYDFLPQSAGKRPKYTTVKFRSGWYSYEMQVNDYYQQAIEAVRLQNEIPTIE